MRIAIPAVFFALAAWFLLGAGPAQIPIPGPAGVQAESIDPAPPRAFQREARVRIGGVEQKCSDCHALFDTQPPQPGGLRQHEHIVLQHGMNDRCVNCHAVDDRNRLALRNGETVAFDEVPILCAKCHGPTYRDWERGTHGRTNGYWDASRGEPRKLVCTECHDPHSPSFAGIAPLPGPNTLRMGTPQVRHSDGPERNPLRKWLGVGFPTIQGGHDDGH